MIEKGTSIHFRSFRHVTLYYGRVKNDKAINLYLSEDGRFLETVAKTLLDKELTILDKDVLVVRIEDSENYKQLISYDLATLTDEKVAFLKQLKISETVELGNLVATVNDDSTTYSRVLVNEKSRL